MEPSFHIVFLCNIQDSDTSRKRVSKFFNNRFSGIDIFIIFTLPNEIEIINLSML